MQKYIDRIKTFSANICARYENTVTFKFVREWTGGEQFDSKVTINTPVIAEGKYGSEYQITRKRRDGSTYDIREDLTLWLWNDNYSVSWKSRVKNAVFAMKMEHSSPRHNHIRVKASESYTADSGAIQCREVVDSLTIEQAELMAAYLMECVRNHKQYQKAKQAEAA